MLLRNSFKGFSALCLIFACFSCQKDKLLIDLSGQHDKVIEYHIEYLLIKE